MSSEQKSNLFSLLTAHRSPLTKIMETVKFELNEAVAVITLNRPEALNALSEPLVADLQRALAQAIEAKPRAVVLTGAGRAFCAGGDLREMKAALANWNTDQPAFSDEHLLNLHRCIQTIRDAPMPFVAAVNGVCAGAGTNFALACDIVFAGESATFNEGFVKIGLTPDCGGSYFLPRLVGEKRAAELLMTGDSISAVEAHKIGMINRVVADENLLDEAIKFAARLAKMPTAGLARIKEMLAVTFKNDLAAQLDLEHQAQSSSGSSTDFKEGVTAFFEKRSPQFTGD